MTPRASGVCAVQTESLEITVAIDEVTYYTLHLYASGGSLLILTARRAGGIPTLEYTRLLPTCIVPIGRPRLQYLGLIDEFHNAQRHTYSFVFLFAAR